MFSGGREDCKVPDVSFFNALRQRTGMMNQQLLHQVSGQPKKRALVIRSARTSRAKRFDFHQFEIELMHDCGGLERVIRALGSHASRGYAAEFGVEKLNQLSGGFMISVAKARHQP